MFSNFVQVFGFQGLFKLFEIGCITIMTDSNCIPSIFFSFFLHVIDGNLAFFEFWYCFDIAMRLVIALEFSPATFLLLNLLCLLGLLLFFKLLLRFLEFGCNHLLFEVVIDKASPMTRVNHARQIIFTLSLYVFAENFKACIKVLLHSSQLLL